MKALQYFKNFIPMQLMFYIKYKKELQENKTLTLGNSKKIFFLDAPDYGNVGDQAIAYAIKKFANYYFNEYEFIEILQNNVAAYFRYLKNTISDNDMIFLTGGGNMGNYYRIYEATRRFIIKNFKNTKIIIFPQSIMYSNNIFGILSLKQAKKIYNAHPNLILFAREEYSYEKMKKHFNHVELCPDIVLSLPKTCTLNINYRKEYLGICLRDDIEKKLSNIDHLAINAFLNTLPEELMIVSTTGEYGEITNYNREYIVLNKIEEISMCKFLVTDRLHAMLFAVITNTPCIVFNNSNSKIVGTYRLLKDYSNVILIDSVEQLKDCMNKVLTCEDYVYNSISYSKLIEQIRK